MDVPAEIAALAASAPKRKVVVPCLDPEAQSYVEVEEPDCPELDLWMAQANEQMRLAWEAGGPETVQKLHKNQP